ncbi:MAG: hypothetical protein ABI716_01935 [Candidatus Saccharibacteria bacterium]
MEFLKIAKRRSFLSELIYVALQIGLALAVVLVIRATESPWPAIGLVALSKWRVLAVKPRYWFVNVQANLVDFIVGISMVGFLHTTYASHIGSSQKLFLIVMFTLLYIGWLLYLKPQSKRYYVVAQAGIALFSGVTALFVFGFDWPVSVVVLLMWLIGYATAHHILASYSETHILFLTLLWAYVMAEFGWLAYHWTIAYGLGIESVLLPRVALTVACIGFVMQQAYDSYYHHQKIRGNDILLPVLFTVSIIVVLPLLLNLLGGANVTIGI